MCRTRFFFLLYEEDEKKKIQDWSFGQYLFKIERSMNMFLEDEYTWRRHRRRLFSVFVKNQSRRNNETQNRKKIKEKKTFKEFEN